MAFDYVLDLFIQFCLKDLLERFINNFSYYLTKLVSSFRKEQFKKNKQFLPHVDVLYQSKHFLVVNKPPDILINSNNDEMVTLQTILRNQFPALRNPKLTHDFYFAHRLDFSTSGILCIPLHKKACVSLSKSFENQKCKKYYVAILNGCIERGPKSWYVNLAIGDDTRYEETSKRMCTELDAEFCKNPRKSQTRFTVLAHGEFENQKVTKVLMQAVTGRRHQLRLHCYAIGHPILGDYTYGSKKDQEMPRMYLHAVRMVAPNDIENLRIQTDDPFNDDSFQFEYI